MDQQTFNKQSPDNPQDRCSHRCDYYYNCSGGCGCGTHQPCEHVKRKPTGAQDKRGGKQ